MNGPLVSIVIISYNSEMFITDVLESVKSQTYKNIELIISDDGSTDSTLEIISSWLDINKDRFLFSKSIKSNINTGITANLNRGLLETNGDYIKSIAADDILLENCITDLLGFVIEGNHRFCFSRALPFSNDIDVTDLIEEDNNNYDFFFRKSQKGQLKSLLKAMGPLSFAIGGFYSKKILEEVDYFDEKYEMMEDYPFFIKLSNMGYKFVFLDKYTVMYRIRNINDKENYKQTKRYKAHYQNLFDFRKREIIPLMIKNRLYISVVYLVMIMYLLKIENNNSNHIYSNLMKGLRKVKQKYMSIKTLKDLQKDEKNEK